MRLSRRVTRRRIRVVVPRRRKEERVALTIRIPKSLRERLDAAAERDRRTVSDYIVIAIEDSVTASEAKAAAETKPKGRG